MAVLPSATANLNLPVITRPVGACGEPSALMSAVPAEPSRFPPVSYFFFFLFFFSTLLFHRRQTLILHSPHHHHHRRSLVWINLSLLLLYFLHDGAVSLVHQVVPTFFIRSFCDVTFLRGSAAAACSLPPRTASSESSYRLLIRCLLSYPDL